MCAVPSVAVLCTSLIPYFPGMLLRYFLNYFETVPVAPIITAITFVFTFHMHSITVVRSLYCRIFWASFFFYHISVSQNCNMYQQTCSFFIITNYAVWFIVDDGSVGLHLLIPQYGYLTFMIYF